MNRYLIEIPHCEQDCFELIQLLHAQDYLMQFDWECPRGVHTGWAVIEADNVTEARLVVPSFVRGQARVVKVCKFEAATLGQVHVDELTPQSLSLISMNTAFPCWW